MYRFEFWKTGFCWPNASILHFSPVLLENQRRADLRDQILSGKLSQWKKSVKSRYSSSDVSWRLQKFKDDYFVSDFSFLIHFCYISLNRLILENLVDSNFLWKQIYCSINLTLSYYFVFVERWMSFMANFYAISRHSESEQR